MPVPQKTQYFRRFLAYALDYKGLLIIAILMGIAKFSLSYGFPWIAGEGINLIVKARDSEPRLTWLWYLVIAGVVLTFLHSAATFGRSYFTARLGNRIIADLRQDLFDHLHRLSLHFYSKERTGSIVSRIINDIQSAAQLINGGVVALVMDMASIFIGLWLTFTIDWRLALASLTVMPLYGITYKYLNPRVKRAASRVQSQISKISGNVQERLAGIALVKTATAEKREAERFKEDTEEHYDRVIEQSALSGGITAISELLVHLGQMVVVGYGGYLAIRGQIQVGDLFKFFGYLQIMYLPVRRFAEINVVYQTSLAAIERVFQVFDITPKITEKTTCVKQPPPRGEVVFENVRFDYIDDSDESQMTLEERPTEAAELKALERRRLFRGGGTGVSRVQNQNEDGLHVPRAPVTAQARPRRWTLDGLSFHVNAGERIALVGPSGSGKTTLVSLLPRLYDVTEGAIRIDGVDLRDYQLRALRRSIGIVQQDSFLFSGTIRDNIKYGRPKANDDEVVEAARAANAHEFIMALPDGYESVLGERGVNLSGGQRQRLSIARAILKNPRILILDEATSALDSESESLVQQALDRLMAGKTCFIIAHRLSTVRNVDRILVIDRGRVAEQGPHADLLRQAGLYARLVHQQFTHHTAQPETLEESGTVSI
jgi:ABC-type multidrug transport system fused ATPase/permease subunit